MKTTTNFGTNFDQNNGIVTRKTIGGFTVTNGDREIQCSLAGRLLFSDTGAGSVDRTRHYVQDDTVSVGDIVSFEGTPDGKGVIVDVLPRRNKFARRSAVPMPSAIPHEQVIAVNVDQIVPVFAASQPEPKWGLLDRYLVAAEAAGLPALVILTKWDLVGNGAMRKIYALEEVMDAYRRIGYRFLTVSAITGEGLEDVRVSLKDRFSVLVGKSGVGKTTLLNALQPDLGLRVNAVSQVTGKGKHTTTHQEMFPLEFGGAVVDTPGIREFGLWDVYPEELEMYFPEMRPYLGTCRFRADCYHDQEPGCAIRKAVMTGEISPYRYQSFMKLLEETS